LPGVTLRATHRRGRRPADETRLAILEAGEFVFADLGYAAARLEDVAERVGIRRASLVYYFRDKLELYEAVLEQAAGPLRERLLAVIERPAPVAERVEAVVAEYADYLGRRPTLARLTLREIADNDPARMQRLHRRAGGVLQRFAGLVAEGQRQGLFDPIDPVQLASMLIGAVVFHYTATPILAPDWQRDPSDPAERDALREELGRWTRRLLGTRGPRLVRAAPGPSMTSTQDPNEETSR
jgi:TetR/AcrR family transcriptional regulator